MAEYRAALKAFDEATCEAMAVGQVVGVRMAAPHIGMAMHVFTRVCAHAVAMVRACPHSRWTKSYADHWDFSAIAGHARSIIEGTLLLHYVIKEPESPEEWHLRLTVMDLNDCSRRIKILRSFASPEELQAFSTQAEELKDRLRQNPIFQALDDKGKKRLLSGDNLTVCTRDEELDELGVDRKQFYMMWNFLSQHAHVLPLSFYRIEPNGRGTGLSNDVDRSYMRMMLLVCADYLAECTDLVAAAFPETEAGRKGLDSKFSPGPARNRPGGAGRALMQTLIGFWKRSQPLRP